MSITGHTYSKITGSQALGTAIDGERYLSLLHKPYFGMNVSLFRFVRSSYLLRCLVNLKPDVAALQ